MSKSFDDLLVRLSQVEKKKVAVAVAQDDEVLLAVKAANGSNMTEDKAYIQKEVAALKSEINRVASTTTFNDQKLMNTGHTFDLQVGAENDTTSVIQVKLNAMDAAGLQVDGVDVSSDAKGAIDSIKSGIKILNDQRASLGAQQNRLEHTVSNLDNISENTSSAESRIRDTDMADEMVNYSKNNILAQAGQSMLAQANQSNQGVLSLLQ